MPFIKSIKITYDFGLVFAYVVAMVSVGSQLVFGEMVLLDHGSVFAIQNFHCVSALMVYHFHLVSTFCSNCSLKSQEFNNKTAQFKIAKNSTKNNFNWMIFNQQIQQIEECGVQSNNLARKVTDI